MANNLTPEELVHQVACLIAGRIVPESDGSMDLARKIVKHVGRACIAEFNENIGLLSHDDTCRDAVDMSRVLVGLEEED